VRAKAFTLMFRAPQHYPAPPLLSEGLTHFYGILFYTQKFRITPHLNFRIFAPMIIYNETIIVEEAIYDEWLKWMKEVHIPSVMATGFFLSYKILAVIDSPNEGKTCCIQYYTDAHEHIKGFYNNHLGGIHAVHQQRYENKFVLFNTLMETIDEG